jgi:hypothetical protein
VYSVIGPLLLSMAGIIFGAKAVAGLEDRHVLDLLLANPISRQRSLRGSRSISSPHRCPPVTPADDAVPLVVRRGRR